MKVLSEDGEIKVNMNGTQQGSPVSPILANIYLHYVLDEWFASNYANKGKKVRYANDVVFVFSSEEKSKIVKFDFIKPK